MSVAGMGEWAAGHSLTVPSTHLAIFPHWRMPAYFLHTPNLYCWKNRKGRFPGVWKIMPYPMIVSPRKLWKIQYLRRWWYRSDELWLGEGRADVNNLDRLGEFRREGLKTAWVRRKEKPWRDTFLGSQFSWKWARVRLAWSNYCRL